ncbi:Fatty acid desaturase [Posidoniimonas corsicana]|uniref:Fatty acid desaturase n=1 Tax=Posidoniimonas corsicana TaxID=1938618 RepID=A0A5C5V2S2_9BACT|nr:fatty acid desaturase [Posidoniimonas corsicana]TWT32239.1 Fatty acid desaturase [Posidoniimonas corsicana]
MKRRTALRQNPNGQTNMQLPQTGTAAWPTEGAVVVPPRTGRPTPEREPQAEPQPQRPAAGPGFSLAQARTIVGQRFQPKPWIYWTDLLASWAVGMLAYQLVCQPTIGWGEAAVTLGWPARVACFFLSSMLIYRCGLFIHELTHIPEGQFVAFRKAWNLMCGIPFLIPSFVYLTHVDHHRRRHYGTQHDGEYLPLSHRSPWHIVGYLAQSLIIPVLAVVRFGVLTPLTWFNTPLRRWVMTHASSMVIDPTYLRPYPTAKALRLIRRQEALTFLYIVAAAVLLYRGAFHDGVVSPWVLLQAYLTGVFVVTVNAVRTLGAHRWHNDQHDEMTFVEQMVDSVTYDNPRSLPWLWAPVGLRYHALHHIFPSMPYHAMGAAHRRLMAELPADSPYRLTVAKSLWDELSGLWRRAAESRQAA